jgi:hypothetical protein
MYEIIIEMISYFFILAKIRIRWLILTKILGMKIDQTGLAKAIVSWEVRQKQKYGYY